MFGDEFPPHLVALDGFWIDRTEVTNAQYRQCVEAGACQAPAACDWGEPAYGEVAKAGHPVVCLDWFGAAAYCEWAGARMPTEAEWEYAARGPQGLEYPWGNEFDGTRLNYCDVNCEESWADEAVDDGYADTAPVGSYPGGASWCGAVDMAGNVWEWVADWYGGYPSEDQTNPVGPTIGDRKVLRGGGWHNSQSDVRTARRGTGTLQYRAHNVGFRCAGQPGE
jgi:formylglycine-generating enzyme required for sulfatase activity